MFPLLCTSTVTLYKYGGRKPSINSSIDFEAKDLLKYESRNIDP